MKERAPELGVVDILNTTVLMKRDERTVEKFGSAGTQTFRKKFSLIET